MFSFLIGVLFIGALIAMVFGKSVAQAFVLSTVGVVWLVIGYVAVMVIGGLISMQFMPKTYYSPKSADQPYTYVPRHLAGQAPPAQPIQPQPVLAAPPVPTPPQPVLAAQDVTAPPVSGPSIGFVHCATTAAYDDFYHIPGGGGIYVSQVYRGGPADAGGLQTGDVIVWLDYRYYAYSSTFSQYEADRGAGKPIHLSVLRGGKMYPFTVTPQ